MQIAGNTVLITGGTSGIGFELAAQLLALGNAVIVTGRHQPDLEATKSKLPNVRTIESDVSDPAAIVELQKRVVEEFPALNVLINNAGIMRKLNLNAPGADLQDITREIDIDLTGAIRMTVQFLPTLSSQERAAILNVSSGLAFVPLPISPIYCAAKAAIHSFTQSLRIQLKYTNVTVFELAPPITRTSLFKGDLSIDDVGVKSMDAKTVAKCAIDGMGKDRLEIRPGLSNGLKLMSRIAPNFMLNRLGRSVDRMLRENTTPALQRS